MSLLIFGYSLAAFLFFFSYFLDSRQEKTNSLFTSMMMTGAFVFLFASLSANLLYTGNSTIGSLLFKVCLACVGFTTLALLRFAFAVPYFTKRKVVNAFSWILLVAGVILVFGFVDSLGWDKAHGFTFFDKPVFGIMGGLSLFSLVYLMIVPALSIFSLLLRGFTINSRIYRQRMMLVAFSIAVGFGVSYFLYYLSAVYYWAWPLVPFGFAVSFVLIHQSVSLTTLFDRTRVIASVINFVILSLLVTALTALIVAIVGELIVPAVGIVIFLVVAVIMLTVRELIASRLRKYIRTGNEYETELEKGLDELDFSAGRDLVINRVVSLLEQYVECSSVEILVTDDKGKLVTVHSTLNAKNEISEDNKALDFLLNRSESIVLKTQAVANHNYADVKTELLKVFDIGRADAFILLREGRRVIGLILLGSKKRGSDYTDYDYSVLSKLYSNFFLVMYFLKNIANEAVVNTVDRELEFSGQIITSIQENIDRINHDKVDVDFITRSARKLGGDFIDFIKLAEDKYLFVMGDVSGKGLNASMSMVILKSVLRTFLSETSDFKNLVVKVNLFIKNNLPKGTFFAGVFGLMDFGTNTMYYINCGVPAMFLYTASYNNAIEIQGDGKVLGFVRDIGKYLKVKKIVLNPQDIILLTTDGLVDSTNLRGERYGKDRVQRILLDNRSYPAGRMAKFLCDSLSDFVSRELEDDITVLVFKYLSK
jgi:serine phosphatase RsbU (regulator of sigma subunit)